jgi:hypothetical protein
VAETEGFLVDVIPQQYVSYLLKERTVEPEKQPLLANALKQHSFLGNDNETNEKNSRC